MFGTTSHSPHIRVKDVIGLSCAVAVWAINKLAARPPSRERKTTGTNSALGATHVSSRAIKTGVAERRANDD